MSGLSLDGYPRGSRDSVANRAGDASRLAGSNPAPSVIAKGQRLRDEGKVIELHLIRAFAVEGDHGTYMVNVAHDRGPFHCTCPATSACSHMAAVAAELLDESGAAA